MNVSISMITDKSNCEMVVLLIGVNWPKDAIVTLKDHSREVHL